MPAKVIYEKKFSKDPIAEELMRRKQADAFNDYQGKFSSFQEMLYDIEKHTTYIPIPCKLRKRNRFIEAAIALSDYYEIDLIIFQSKGQVLATYSFDICTGIKNLHKIMDMVDEFDFFPDINGHKICMTLNYYTHKIVHKHADP